MIRRALDSRADIADGEPLSLRSDAELISRFGNGLASEREEAFATLVERHGPMVLATCRSIVGDEQDAQDAFQGAFLVLARKARGLWVRGSLAPWLYGVARRVASDVRKSAARRRLYERRAATMNRHETTAGDGPEACELASILHEEVGRLSWQHRHVLVLCDLEGRTHQEVAALLGCQVGTVKSRQSRARRQLRERLERRGLAMASLLLTWPVARARAASSPGPELVRATTASVARFASVNAIGATGCSLARWPWTALAVAAWTGATAPQRWLAASLAAASLAVALITPIAGRAPRAGTADRPGGGAIPRGSIAALRWRGAAHGPMVGNSAAGTSTRTSAAIASAGR